LEEAIPIQSSALLLDSVEEERRNKVRVADTLKEYFLLSLLSKHFFIIRYNSTSKPTCFLKKI
jgi:hypothetical protein